MSALLAPLPLLALLAPPALGAPTAPRALTLPLRAAPRAPPPLDPNGLRRRHQRREAGGGIPLDSFATQYSITMDVGTPPQPLELMFDTGSPALWIMDECIVTDQCGMSALFDSGASRSLMRSRESWGMIYGAGEVSGVVAKEVVGVAGMRGETEIGLVGHTPNWGHAASGLVGFGPPSDYAITPWWADVAKTWPEPRFAFFVGQTADWLSPIPLNTTVRGAGSVTLGGVDTSLFEGELFSSPSNVTKWWTVGLEGVRVNGESIDIDAGLAASTYGLVHGLPSAMLDTGVSVVVGPTPAVERVYQAVKGAFQAYESETFFAPLTSPPPSIDICFGGACWPAPLLDMSDCRSRADMLGWFPAQMAAADAAGVTEETWCVGNVYPGGGDAGAEFPQWSLGDAFLQHVYVVHQLSPPEVLVGRLSAKARRMVKEANVGLNRALGG